MLRYVLSGITRGSTSSLAARTTTAPRRAARVGPLGVNAVAFAGSLLVRSEAELAYIEARGPWDVLRDAGVPWEG